MGSNPFGKTWGIKDPRVGAELDRIYELLQRKVTSTHLNLEEIAPALGAAFGDGQLEALNRVLDGRASGTRLLLQDGSGEPSKYTLYAAKLATVDAAFPAIFFSFDDDTLETCRIEQQGNGPVLFIATAGGGRLIDTDVTGCFLSSGGIWTDASGRARKTSIVVPEMAPFIAKVREMPVVEYEYKDRRGNPSGERHIGTFAEDFHRLFGYGSPDGVAAIDVASVALTTVKYLLDEVDALKRRVAELEAKHAADDGI